MAPKTFKSSYAKMYLITPEIYHRILDKITSPNETEDLNSLNPNEEEIQNTNVIKEKDYDPILEKVEDLRRPIEIEKYSASDNVELNQKDQSIGVQTENLNKNAATQTLHNTSSAETQTESTHPTNNAVATQTKYNFKDMGVQTYQNTHKNNNIQGRRFTIFSSGAQVMHTLLLSRVA